MPYSLHHHRAALGKKPVDNNSARSAYASSYYVEGGIGLNGRGMTMADRYLERMKLKVGLRCRLHAAFGVRKRLAITVISDMLYDAIAAHIKHVNVETPKGR